MDLLLVCGYLVDKEPAVVDCVLITKAKACCLCVSQLVRSFWRSYSRSLHNSKKSRPPRDDSRVSRSARHPSRQGDGSQVSSVMMSERGHCGYSALGLWPREEQARLVTVAARDLHDEAKAGLREECEQRVRTAAIPTSIAPMWPTSPESTKYC